MPEKPTKRIAYIDWLRGFACLVMFQTHCYDSWLGGAARDGGFLKLSQLGGTLPAPLFLFLAGISFAMVTDKLRQKGVSADDIARTTILRGGEIVLLALLFRLQEFLLAMGHAPWTDLLRVDVLNIIGLSLIMMGIACRIAAAGGAGSQRAFARKLRTTIVTAVACAADRNCLLRHCGPRGNRTGARGGWSPISMECTRSASRSRGCSRCSRGLRLHLWDWRLALSYYRIGRAGMRPRLWRLPAWVASR